MTNSPDSYTWIGKPLPIKDEDVLNNDRDFHFPPKFADQFNKDPFEGAKFLFDYSPDFKLSSNYFLSRILFYCPNLSYSSITNYFLSAVNLSKTEYRDNRKSLFYFYFQSINLDYIDISEAAQLLLSRVAIPLNSAQIKIILEAFGEAYCFANKYISESPKDVAIFGKAAILYSMDKVNNKKMPRDEFKQILNESDFPDDAKETFLEEILKNPIPVCFTFFDSRIEPSFEKSGYFTRFGKKHKRKKKIKLDITKGKVTYFKDYPKDTTERSFKLIGIIAEIVPQEQKSPAHLIIKKNQEVPFDLTIRSKGHENTKNKNQLALIPDNSEDLVAWKNCIEYNSCFASLYNLIL